VRVAHAGSEEEVEDPGEHRVTDIAVEPGHRTGLDALHAVAHHEVGALVELRHEAGNVAEVVGEVGVGHHDVLALCGGEAGAVSAPVTAPRLVHDHGAGRARELGAAVVRAVVGDDDLALPALACERRARVGDAALDRCRLVQAGDHHGHLDRGKTLAVG
jgi:hypothetical protein